MYQSTYTYFDNAAASAMIQAGIRNPDRIIRKLEAINHHFREVCEDLNEQIKSNYVYAVYKDGAFIFNRLQAKTIEKKELYAATADEVINGKKVKRKHQSLKMVRAFYKLSQQYESGYYPDAFSRYRGEKIAETYYSYYKQAIKRNGWNLARINKIMERLDSR